MTFITAIRCQPTTLAILFTVSKPSWCSQITLTNYFKLERASWIRMALPVQYVVGAFFLSLVRDCHCSLKPGFLLLILIRANLLCCFIRHWPICLPENCRYDTTMGSWQTKLCSHGIYVSICFRWNNSYTEISLLMFNLFNVCCMHKLYFECCINNNW